METDPTLQPAPRNARPVKPVPATPERKLAVMPRAGRRPPRPGGLLAVAGCAALFSLLVGARLEAQATSENDERLKRALRQYPEADANQDGVLTESEARAHLRQLKSGAAGKAAKSSKAAGGPDPTLADVRYGPHERNVLDFWRATSDQPAPLVVFIHGGGFVSGDKSKVRGDRILRQCLEAGVSFAAINYRFRTAAPIQDVLRDCARAIQFLRSRAAEWNIDKSRVASFGGSAGAGTSLWLAFHDDLADPGSADPVLRESTRLVCAAANACQFSYDILRWEELFGPAARKFDRAGEDHPAFYGLKTEAELRGPLGARLRADCDMHGLISKDDPPVFLASPLPGGEVTDRGHLLHHPLHAKAIHDRCREVGVVCVADVPGAGLKPAPDGDRDLQAFLFRHLKVTARP